MEEMLNRALTFLLIVAIVASITGTIISINRLNQLIPKITGLGTTTTGVVNISLAKVNSISIVDSQINFGSCSPNASIGSNLSSNVTNTTVESWGSPGVCSAFPNSPDNITIKNDGNANINVSVKTNALASTFIGGNDPYDADMYFSVRNASDYPGCNNASSKGISDTGVNYGMQWDWKNFSAINTNYLACANLTPVQNYDSMYVFAKIFIPADAPIKTGANATLTFTATSW